MAANDYEAFYRSLKRDGPRPAYYFQGAEDVLKDQALSHLLDAALDPSARDFNLDLVSADQVAPEAVCDLCRSLPLMAERRVVVVRGIEAWKRRNKGKKVLTEYLRHSSGETTLVLLQGSADEKVDKALAAVTYAVDFASLPPHHLRRWLKQEAAARGLTFGEGADEHLLAAAGSDLGRLGSELEKLAAVAEDGAVTLEQCESLVGIRRGETVFDWREAVLDGRPDDAVRLVPHVLSQSGVSGVRLVTLLGVQLVGVGIARAHYDDGTRGRALQSAIFDALRKARPFGLQSWKDEAANWARWAPAWSLVRIGRALRLARDADAMLKDTRVSSEAGVLTDLVLRLTIGAEVPV